MIEQLTNIARIILFILIVIIVNNRVPGASDRAADKGPGNFRLRQAPPVSACGKAE